MNVIITTKETRYIFECVDEVEVEAEDLTIRRDDDLPGWRIMNKQRWDSENAADS